MGVATAIIHSVRLISAAVDRSDAFVAIADGRVLATGTGNGWRELAGVEADVLDGAGAPEPRTVTATAARPFVRQAGCTASTG